MKKAKLLIIEDEEGIREGLKIFLSKHYDLDFAANGLDGLKLAIRRPPNAILLDLKMPEMDGFQVCRAIRLDKEFDNVPILILSAFNNVLERTKLFEIGADDYITKPFDPKELLARIQRGLSRNNLKTEQVGESSQTGILQCGDLKLDLRNQELHVNNQLIGLSSLEFKLLHILVTNYDQLVSRDEIVNFVWEKQSVSTRLIDPHILSLRHKMEGQNVVIQSIYGRGYLLKTLS